MFDRQLNYCYPVSTNTDDFDRLKQDLPVIMAFAGWTTMGLAKLLGITHSSFMSIKSENGRMKTVHYLAICRLIDNEVRGLIDVEPNRALHAAINILNSAPGTTMSREELIEHVQNEKRRIGTKLQGTKLKPELCSWLREKGEVF